MPIYEKGTNYPIEFKIPAADAVYIPWTLLRMGVGWVYLFDVEPDARSVSCRTPGVVCPVTGYRYLWTLILNPAIALTATFRWSFSHDRVVWYTYRQGPVGVPVESNSAKISGATVPAFPYHRLEAQNVGVIDVQISGVVSYASFRAL